MLANPMDVLEQFPVRKSKAQKQAFRDAVQAYAKKQGYDVAVESGSFGSRNVVIGDPKNAKVLLTAHYDTPARLPFPNYITPCNFVGFLLCQLFQWFFVFAVAVVIGVAAAFLLGEAWTTLAAVLSVYGTVFLMLIGPANKHNANDNTSGVVTVLEIARTLPENQRHKVCFVLFDLEEAGLLGSASYRKKYRAESDSQLVLNLDCVGDGDHIRLFPSKQLRKDRKKCTSLYKACGYFGPKEILLQEKGFSSYPSDQRHFPLGVGICALRRGKLGLYLGRVHTPKDTVLDVNNVNLLRSALTTYICLNAAN